MLLLYFFCMHIFAYSNILVLLSFQSAARDSAVLSVERRQDLVFLCKTTSAFTPEKDRTRVWCVTSRSKRRVHWRNTQWNTCSYLTIHSETRSTTWQYTVKHVQLSGNTQWNTCNSLAIHSETLATLWKLHCEAHEAILHWRTWFKSNMLLLNRC